jgi:hypothetical protein
MVQHEQILVATPESIARYDRPMGRWESKTLVVLSLAMGLFGALSVFSFLGSGQAGEGMRWGLLFFALPQLAFATACVRELVRRQKGEASRTEDRLAAAVTAGGVVHAMVPIAPETSTEIADAAYALVAAQVTEVRVTIRPVRLASGQWIQRHTIASTPESALTAKTSARLQSAADSALRQLEARARPMPTLVKATVGPRGVEHVEVEIGD